MNNSERWDGIGFFLGLAGMLAGVLIGLEVAKTYDLDAYSVGFVFGSAGCIAGMWCAHKIIRRLLIRDR